MEEIINKIIDELSKNISFDENDRAKFDEDGYEAVGISKKNFNQIEDFESDRKICFVDGGNQEIIRSSNFSLQLIRVYFNIFKDKKKIKQRKKEFFILVKTKEENLDFEVDFFGDYFEELGDLVFDSMDKRLRTGNHRVIISKIGDVIRRFSEILFAVESLDSLDDGIVVLDGDLKADKPKEKEFLDKLYDKATENKAVIVGLSKTTSLLTEKGNSLGALLNQMSPDKEWFYYPIAKIENESHKVEMYFVKLHEKAKRIFRLEVFKGNGFEIKEILGLLKSLSGDPIFVGYPYGLVDADKFARVSNKEREYYRTTIMAKLGKEWENMEKFTSTLDAHEILDNVI